MTSTDYRTLLLHFVDFIELSYFFIVTFILYSYLFLTGKSKQLQKKDQNYAEKNKLEKIVIKKLNTHTNNRVNALVSIKFAFNFTSKAEHPRLTKNFLRWTRFGTINLYFWPRGLIKEMPKCLFIIADRSKHLNNQARPHAKRFDIRIVFISLSKFVWSSMRI